MLSERPTDFQRLDWMESNLRDVSFTGAGFLVQGDETIGHGKTLREAVDKIMEQRANHAHV